MHGYARIVTWLHLLVLVLGAVAAVAASDLLGHRGIRPWPIGLVVLALVVAAGWFYSAWLAAAALGTGVGLLIVGGAGLVRTFVRHRRLRSERRASPRTERIPGSDRPGR